MSFTIFWKDKTPFQAIKTRSSKGRKIDIFPIALTHGFRPNMAIFPTFCQAIQVRKMCVTIFWNDKTSFQTIKTRSSKSQKIDIFRKALTPCFGPNMAFFLSIFFRQYRLGKCLLRYSGAIKRLSRLQKQEVQKVEKFTFFQRG